MAKQYFRKKAIYAKKEVTYGVDPTPTGANAIQTRDLTITPLAGEALSLQLDKPTLGNDLGTMVGKHVSVTFRVPVAGSGAAGTAPAWGVLMEGCGMQETLVASTSATYAPNDDEGASLTFYMEADKCLHKFTGARGSVKMIIDKRNYPWWEFTYMGLYEPIVVNAAPFTPVYTPWIKPVVFRASTVNCTLIGTVVGLHNITLDFGQQVEFYEHSEAESIQISDRKPTFNASFEEPEIGTHDFWNDTNTDATGALIYAHGITAGNIVTVNSPLSQITSIDRQDVQGVSALQVSGPMVRSGVTPDFSIVAT